MTAPIPQPVPGGESGLPDSTWITAVRDFMSDWPANVVESKATDGTSGVIAPGTWPYRVANPRINDASLQVKVGSTTYTVITSGAPGAGQVLANLDTGELSFASAPTASQTLAVVYQHVKWRDQSIVDALYAGLRLIFPRSGKIHTDTSIQNQINLWDFTLPPWAGDPRAAILNVEVRDPDIITEDYRPVKRFDRVGSQILHIGNSQSYSPSARYRITGWGPYLELADLEPQLFYLPVWYAAGSLLLRQAALQARSDSIPAIEQGAQKINDQVVLGQSYLAQFKDALSELEKSPGPGRRMKVVTSYDR